MKNENEEIASVESDIPAGALAKSSDQIRVRSEDYFRYYANSIAINMSGWDVGLIFGEIAGDRDGKAVIEESVKILISRETAKVLNKILTDQIAKYEKVYGVIRIPVPVQPPEIEGLQEEPSE
jgi:hypothetical protein